MFKDNQLASPLYSNIENLKIDTNVDSLLDNMCNIGDNCQLNFKDDDNNELEYIYNNTLEKKIETLNNRLNEKRIQIKKYKENEKELLNIIKNLEENNNYLQRMLMGIMNNKR